MEFQLGRQKLLKYFKDKFLVRKQIKMGIIGKLL